MRLLAARMVLADFMLSTRPIRVSRQFRSTKVNSALRRPWPTMVCPSQSPYRRRPLITSGRPSMRTQSVSFPPFSGGRPPRRTGPATRALDRESNRKWFASTTGKLGHAGSSSAPNRRYDPATNILQVGLGRIGARRGHPFCRVGDLPNDARRPGVGLASADNHARRCGEQVRDRWCCGAVPSASQFPRSTFASSSTGIATVAPPTKMTSHGWASV